MFSLRSNKEPTTTFPIFFVPITIIVPFVGLFTVVLPNWTFAWSLVMVTITTMPIHNIPKPARRLVLIFLNHFNEIHNIHFLFFHSLTVGIKSHRFQPFQLFTQAGNSLFTHYFSTFYSLFLGTMPITALAMQVLQYTNLN